MKRKIFLRDLFGDNLFTRSSISSFFEKLNSLKEKEIILDFKEIDFISRSCADEYLKQKKYSKKKIIEVNLSENLCAMFRNVESQYKSLGLTISKAFCSTKRRLAS